MGLKAMNAPVFTVAKQKDVPLGTSFLRVFSFSEENIDYLVPGRFFFSTFFLPSQVTSKYNQPSMDLDNIVAGLTVAIGAALS
ncbi:hypothetical protein FYJ61_00165 [Lactobacillus equicursoris]|uniref:Uncharacterized protein n=1 Tax=Lactobacillus equicursoris TaxID=420645 RepID=A0A844FKV7_9LACO|nr:hypothetical protein [Lactobacillus equicursoris]MST78925.1 hypothetical protein [Lactobacillus equicursoris]